MEQARGFFKKAINTIKKPEMRVLPGQLAFFLVISLIPLAALLGAIASSLSIPVETLQRLMTGVFPNAVITIIIDIINNKGPNFNIAVFFISAFILASNGPHSMIITSNEIYKTESSNPISRRVKAIIMTVFMAGLFLVLFLIPICGDYIFELIKYNVEDKTLIDFIYILYQLIKYPLLVIVLFYNIKYLYIMACDGNSSSINATKGAIFTTIGWIIATEIYTIYIGAFTSYDKFYGSISNIIILLLWIYLLSYIFILGMVINAESFRINSNTKEILISDDEDIK